MLFPIEDLIKGRALITIREEDTVKSALELMITHDYSQLPIVDAQRKLSGIITEKSIAETFHALGNAKKQMPLFSQSVGHCRRKPVTLPRGRDIFEALEALERTAAVVVVDDNHVPLGILTDYDAAIFFRDYSQELIRVQDVETTLRDYIRHVFEDEGFLRESINKQFPRESQNPNDTGLVLEDLTLRQEIEFICSKPHWYRFQDYFGPKDLFYTHMEAVRKIRNDLAHFKGNIGALEKNALLNAIDWLEGRPGIHLNTSLIGDFISEDATTYNTTAAPTSPISQLNSPILKDDVPTNGDTPLAHELLTGIPRAFRELTLWLKAQHSQRKKGSKLGLLITDLERLIGEKLPTAAMEHRSWWLNDPDLQPHAAAWLRAGWIVESVDMTWGQVTFLHSKGVLYQMFFRDLLREAQVGSEIYEEWGSLSISQYVRGLRAPNTNVLAIPTMVKGIGIKCTLTSHRTLRVEVYFHKRDREWNKKALERVKYAINNVGDGSFLHDFEIIFDHPQDSIPARIYTERLLTIYDSADQIKKGIEWAVHVMDDYLLTLVEHNDWDTDVNEWGKPSE